MECNHNKYVSFRNHTMAYRSYFIHAFLSYSVYNQKAFMLAILETRPEEVTILMI